MENHDGTDKLYRSNLLVFPGTDGHSQYGKPCFEDTPDTENNALNANNTLRNNTCWLASDVVLLANLCNASVSLNKTVSIKSHHDRYYTPSGDFKIRCTCAPTPGSPATCQGSKATMAFNYSLAQWQAGGVDVGSMVKPLPPPHELLAEIILRSRELLR
jgi:hypothetical protein